MFNVSGLRSAPTPPPTDHDTASNRAFVKGVFGWPLGYAILVLLATIALGHR